MNIKIGANIKKLRTENNITQDALATAIGVTPQAVSRWESEGGYPDIELLPALADFFSVSVDELIGYRLSERERSLPISKKNWSGSPRSAQSRKGSLMHETPSRATRTIMKSGIILRCACILCGRRAIMSRLSER